MLKWVNLGLLAALTATPAAAQSLGLGRTALPEEIAAWDMTVLPDGTGLPEGSGDVWTGDEVFAENCAACHGDFAEGLDNWPALAGGDGSLQDRRPVKTIGSYWPYLSTAWDYIHRSMPFGSAQTLTADDTYAIVAYLLYSNGLVEDDFTLSKDNFTDVPLPNADGFYIDDRPEVEYSLFSAAPCMTDCTDEVAITKRAVDLNVTPTDANGQPAGTLPNLHMAAGEGAAPPADDSAATTPEPEAPTGPDPELVAAGERVFKKCQACHKVGDGARNGTGPQLNGIIDRPVASAEGFRYSAPMSALGESGSIWDRDHLTAYLADPRGTVQGTRMTFAGLKDQDDIAAVLEYLSTFPAE